MGAGATAWGAESGPGSGLIGPRGPSTAFLAQDSPAGLSGAAGLGLLGFMAVGALTAWLTLRSRGDLRPDRLRTRAERADGLSPVGWMAAGIVLWLIWQIGGSIAVQSMPPPAPGEAAESLARTARIMWPAYAAGLGAAGILFAALRPRLVRAGFRMKAIDPLLGFGLLLVVYPFVYVAGDLSLRLTGALARAGLTQPPEGPAHETLRLLVGEGRFDPAWWATTLMVVFATPVLEEVIHRGCIQTAFARLTERPWTAIVVSSAVFSAIHLGAAPLYALPGLFVLSLGLGWAFERTGRLAVPIAMHAVFNAMNILMAALASGA